jgi:hypothetical protein
MRNSASKNEGEPPPGKRKDPGTERRQPPTRSTGDAKVCLLCGAAMYGVHCKLICPNCGYREDCSDLFPE